MKKIPFLKTFCLSLYSLILCVTNNAQSISLSEIKEQMVRDWVRAKEYTSDYLNTMESDKYSFKANDSTRSFAQQMLHLAWMNVLYTSIATDQKPLPWAKHSLQNSSSAQSKDSVMYYVMASYDYAIDAIKNSDVSKWGEIKKVLGAEVTRFALMNKVFEHQTHHRGQTTIYIRLLNMRPPNERLNVPIP
jgi:uncharacterized damage-inducible protein DinB